MQVGQSYAKIIIVASWKMGSTLLADLLGSHPSSLVLYEPLWHYGVERLTTQKAPFITYVTPTYGIYGLNIYRRRNLEIANFFNFACIPN